VRRGTAVIASQLPLPRLRSAAVQDCKWRYIKWASFTFFALPGRAGAGTLQGNKLRKM